MITPLPFDSALFGYPVGKCLVTDNWNEETFLKEAHPFQLVYLYSEKELSCKSSSIALVDVKLTYLEHLNQEVSLPKDIQRWEGELQESLTHLALESGVYSRFKTDLRLKNGEFEKLYRLWIRKVWEKGEIFCATNQEGLVTVSVEGQLAKIGLLAVDSAYRKQGWGRKLVIAAEAFAIQMGAERMLIPTQQKNLPACKLYRSLGYELTITEWVYHWHQSPQPVISTLGEIS
ncbi:hypothetical protein GCM10009119_38620 [Algoriphagus jejuensis]|uniref:N-acetyltransferase domain-containing protein n=1 Tax=Algoriphagus jejuensis TaxID=419934 RepID=A0ABN1N4V4_9BACT